MADVPVPDGQYRDPVSGQVVHVRGGAVLLARGGKVYRATPAEAGQKIKEEAYTPATPADIAAHDTAQREEAKPFLQKAGESLEAGAMAAGRGVVDVVTGLPRAATALGSAALGTEDPLAGISGAQFYEDLGALMDADPVRGANVIRQYQRQLAERNPTATFVGGMAGQIAGAGPVAGAAETLPGRLALGAIEGGGMGGTGTAEEAYLHNTPLNRDKVLAGIGMGALFGLGVTGAGELAGAAARRVFGPGRPEAAEGASKALAGGSAEQRGGYRTAASPEDYDALVKQVTGQEPAPGVGSKLADVAEAAQSAATGAERETLAEYGAFRGGEKARSGRQMWMDREKILDSAAKDLTEDVDTLVSNRKDIFDEVADARLKRSNVAGKLTGDREEMLAAGTQELQTLRAELREMSGVADESARTGPTWTEFLKQRMGPAMAEHGGDHAAAVRALGAEFKALKQNAPISAEAARAAEAADTYGNTSLLRNTAKHIERLEKEALASGNPEDVFIALDQAKRALQRERVALGRSAIRQPDAFKAAQARALGQRFEDMQERTRNLLMDEGIWGKAANDQRAINSAWEEWFQSRALFERNLLTRVGETFDGRPIVRADTDKVTGYLGKLGRQQGALADEQIRHHVMATQKLADAIGNAFELGDKKAIVTEIGDAAARIGKSLDKADRTIKAANQIQAVIEAEHGAGHAGGLVSTALGGALGGPLGAMAGAAVSLLTRPGNAIRTRAAIEAMIRKMDQRVEGGVSRLLGTGEAKAAGGGAGAKLLEAAGETLEKGRQAAPHVATVAFTRPGEDPHKAYRRHVDDITEAMIDQPGTHQKLTKATQKYSTVAPDLTGNVVLGGSNALQFLHDKIPQGSMRIDTLTGKAKPEPVNDMDLDSFRTYWETVQDPLRVLDDARRGLLVKEQVETLKAVYPDLFADIQLRVRQGLATTKKEPSYDLRIQLDLLLDLNGDGEPSLAPSFQRLLKQVSMMPESGPTDTAIPAAGSGGTRMVNSKLAERTNTLGQSTESAF